MIGLLLCFGANLLLSAVFAAAEETCKGVKSIDASVKGSLFSPMYNKSLQYPPNLNCQYKLKAPDGHKLKVTFKDFDLALSERCVADQLAIYGLSRSRELGVFCGNQLPRPVFYVWNQMTIVFRTDFIHGGRGFHLEYESDAGLKLCEDGLEECRNRNCYSRSQVCNGVDDCGDGTDEEKCGHRLKVYPIKCGMPEIPPRTILGSDRMVGGEEAIPNSWPWQVSLQLPNIEPDGHFCGGSLINTLWVLTATHCVDGRANPGNIRVVLGAHGKFNTTQYQQVRYSHRVVAYPELLGFQIRTYQLVNDVSLIRLNAPVILTPGVQPACLPHFGYHPKPGWQCYATGWGETRGTGSTHALKQSLQTVKGEDQCAVKNQTTQVCVGNTAESACHGDSGGPLQCKVSNKWYVVGAASYVTTNNLNNQGLCAGPGAHTVYAATAFKYNWIEDMILKYSQYSKL